jgi:hypothetical protein
MSRPTPRLRRAPPCAQGAQHLLGVIGKSSIAHARRR